MIHLIIALKALGKAEILTPLVRLTPLQGRSFAAALYLFLERVKPVKRTALAEALWPGTADSARQHRLRQTLLELKQAGIPIEANRESVAFPANSRKSDLDVLFIHGAGDIDSLESLQFLPGYSPAFSRDFSDWLDAKRSEVSAASSRLLINEIRRARGRGDWLRVERLALKCMDVDPFNEEAVLARAEASAMRGAKREAVTILDRYVADLGPGSGDLKLPANLMRKRIAERVPEAAFAARTEPIFVGRESDMQALTALLEDARGGSGRCCLVWGDAGIGKSRLAAELGKFGELQGVQVRRVACRRGDAQRPLSVFVEAVPVLREMRGAIGCSPDTMADLQRLTQFDIGSGAKEALDLDPQSIFELIRLAIFDLIDAVSEEQCLMLVVEDVHWLDAASARILGQIADRATKKQLLLVFTSRLRENPLLEACTRAGLITYRLRPLSKEAATVLVNDMFEATNEKRDEEFLAWCRKVGDGNPFFLQELVKQWLETKQRHAIPPSITTVIRDRFSRLSSEATQLLQACSILGENSTLPRVERMLQQEPYLILGALNELSKAAMLSPERKAVGNATDFHLTTRHDLVSTVALEELDPHAAVFLNRRAGEVLESELGGDTQDTSLLWACAQHWQKAGDEERSVTLAISCGEQLLKLGLPQEAADAFRKTLAHCSVEIKKTALLDRQLFALQSAHQWNEVKSALTLARPVHVLVGSHDHYELLYFDAVFRSSFDYGRLVDQLLPCITKDLSPEHRVRAAAIALKAASDLRNDVLLDQIYRCISPLLTEPTVSEIEAREIELIYHCVRGDGSRVTQLADGLAEAARRSENPVQMGAALSNAAFANVLHGHILEGEALLIESFDRMMSLKLFRRAWHISLEIVRVYLDLEDTNSARHWFDRFDHSLMTRGERDEEIRFAWAAAKLAVAEGNLPEAIKHFAVVQTVPECERTLQWQNGTAGVAVRVQLLRGDDREGLRSAVEVLMACQLKFRNAGRQDYEAYSLYLGFRALADERRARQILKEYSKQRRERTPLPLHLQKALTA